MRMTMKGSDGLTNYYCEKCQCSIGAIGGSAVWCGNGHRMLTKVEITERDQRKLEREAKKNG
jgi:hypothetical protein